MGWTLRTANHSFNGTSDTTITLFVTGMVAGDFVVAYVSTDTSGSTITSVDDGTDTFTGLGVNTDGTLIGQQFYLLSSHATGSFFYTATFNQASSNRYIGVYVITPSGTVTFDTSRADGHNANSSTVDSGAITTTGTDEIVVAASVNQTQQTLSSPQINSIAADNNEGASDAQWYSVMTSPFTGSATATLAAATRWVCNVAAFKIGGGVLPPVPAKRMVGVSYSQG